MKKYISDNPTNQEQLLEQWGYYLKKFANYQWFCTFTFIDNTGDELADSQYFKFIRKLNTYIYGKRYREKGKGVNHIRAKEMQKRGVLHFHCLISGIPPELETLIQRESWCIVWQQQHSNNGYANIQTVKDNLNVSNYCAKYMAKGGEVDIYPNPTLKEKIINRIAQKVVYQSTLEEGRKHNVKLELNRKN